MPPRRARRNQLTPDRAIGSHTAVRVRRGIRRRRRAARTVVARRRFPRALQMTASSSPLVRCLSTRRGRKRSAAPEERTGAATHGRSRRIASSPSETALLRHRENAARRWSQAAYETLVVATAVHGRATIASGPLTARPRSSENFYTDRAPVRLTHAARHGARAQGNPPSGTLGPLPDALGVDHAGAVAQSPDRSNRAGAPVGGVTSAQSTHGLLGTLNQSRFQSRTSPVIAAAGCAPSPSGPHRASRSCLRTRGALKQASARATSTPCARTPRVRAPHPMLR